MATSVTAPARATTVVAARTSAAAPAAMMARSWVMFSPVAPIPPTRPRSWSGTDVMIAALVGRLPAEPAPASANSAALATRPCRPVQANSRGTEPGRQIGRIRARDQHDYHERGQVRDERGQHVHPDHGRARDRAGTPFRQWPRRLGKAVFFSGVCAAGSEGTNCAAGQGASDRYESHE